MAQPQPLAADNFLLPNATFIAEFIAFLLILVIIARYIVPPVQKAMRERQAIIKQQMEDADQAREKLAEAQSAYQKALSEARNEAAQIRENARAEAQRNVEEMRTQAQEEAARIVARGEEQLARQRGALVRELRAEIGTLAVELSEKIVGQRLADNSQVSATVDSFIAGLDAEAGESDRAANTSGSGSGGATAFTETSAGSST
jgi:F-type H+-transporting ATPase subunit b